PAPLSRPAGTWPARKVTKPKFLRKNRTWLGVNYGGLEARRKPRCRTLSRLILARASPGKFGARGFGQEPRAVVGDLVNLFQQRLVQGDVHALGAPWDGHTDERNGNNLNVGVGGDGFGLVLTPDRTQVKNKTGTRAEFVPVRNDVPDGKNVGEFLPSGVEKAGGAGGEGLIEQLRKRIRVLEQVPVSLAFPPAPDTRPLPRPSCSLLPPQTPSLGPLPPCGGARSAFALNQRSGSANEIGRS